MTPYAIATPPRLSHLVPHSPRGVIHCAFRDLATGQTFTETTYKTGYDEVHLTNSFQEFDLFIDDISDEFGIRTLTLKVIVNGAPTFNVSGSQVYDVNFLQKKPSQIFHVATEYPGLGDTLWFVCNGKLKVKK